MEREIIELEAQLIRLRQEEKTLITEEKVIMVEKRDNLRAELKRLSLSNEKRKGRIKAWREEKERQLEADQSIEDPREVPLPDVTTPDQPVTSKTSTEIARPILTDELPEGATERQGWPKPTPPDKSPLTEIAELHKIASVIGRKADMSKTTARRRATSAKRNEPLPKPKTHQTIPVKVHHVHRRLYDTQSSPESSDVPRGQAQSPTVRPLEIVTQHLPEMAGEVGQNTQSPGKSRGTSPEHEAQIWRLSSPEHEAQIWQLSSSEHEAQIWKFSSPQRVEDIPPKTSEPGRREIVKQTAPSGVYSPPQREKETAYQRARRVADSDTDESVTLEIDPKLMLLPTVRLNRLEVLDTSVIVEERTRGGVSKDAFNQCDHRSRKQIRRDDKVMRFVGEETRVGFQHNKRTAIRLKKQATWREKRKQQLKEWEEQSRRAAEEAGLHNYQYDPEVVPPHVSTQHQQKVNKPPPIKSNTTTAKPRVPESIQKTEKPHDPPSESKQSSKQNQENSESQVRPNVPKDTAKPKLKAGKDLTTGIKPKLSSKTRPREKLPVATKPLEQTPKGQPLKHYTERSDNRQETENPDNSKQQQETPTVKRAKHQPNKHKPSEKPGKKRLSSSKHRNDDNESARTSKHQHSATTTQSSIRRTVTCVKEFAGVPARVTDSAARVDASAGGSNVQRNAVANPSIHRAATEVKEGAGVPAGGHAKGKAGGKRPSRADESREAAKKPRIKVLGNKQLKVKFKVEKRPKNRLEQKGAVAGDVEAPTATVTQPPNPTRPNPSAASGSGQPNPVRTRTCRPNHAKTAQQPTEPDGGQLRSVRSADRTDNPGKRDHDREKRSEPVTVRGSPRRSETSLLRAATTYGDVRERAKPAESWKAVPIFTISDEDEENEPRVERLAITWPNKGPFPPTIVKEEWDDERGTSAT